MTELHFQHIKGQARQILRAILKTPEISSCNLKDVMLIRLACEEIIMNITSYAYPDDIDGYLDVDIQRTDRITIRFKDGGVPFNPLEQEKPDTHLSWMQRHVGGLGIYLVTKKMDAVSYAYENSRNVLSIEKIISE